MELFIGTDKNQFSFNGLVVNVMRAVPDTLDQKN